MSDIQRMNLSAVDLNLLVALDALLAERHVTRAAVRVGLSQPAMSHALARLRDLLRDPLLVRTGAGMVPTARAAALRAPLARALEGAAECLDSGAAFDPRRMARVTLATTDYANLVLVPRVLRRLRREAPAATIVVRPLDVIKRGGAPAFAHEIDLALSLLPTGVSLPREFDSQVLLAERFVVVVRRDHGGIGRRLAPKRFAALDHVVVAPVPDPPQTLVDQALARLGLRRRVAAVVPDFTAAALVVSQSDLAALIPERMAAALGRIAPLRRLPVPVRLDVPHLAMVWPRRSTGLAAHRWLRHTITDLAAGLV